MFLTEQELIDLTRKVRPSAQKRVLDFMEIPAKERPDGSLVVLRVHVESMPTPRQVREPSLRLDA